MDAGHAVHLLIVGSSNSAFHLAASMAQDAGAQVIFAHSIADALASLRDVGGDVVMIDIDQDIAAFISQLRAERIAIPVLACGVDASADRAVAAIRAGARDYVPLPPQADLIAAAIMSVSDHAVRMIGSDPEFARATALALAMAPSSAPLLITGPHGCGKQILARAIHNASGRRGRFLTVDCTGSSDEILESELFGHATGAFVGAIASRRGRIEEAADGAILLRQIDALSPHLQARLLEFLQDSGDTRKHPSNTRVIASTSADLEAAAAKGEFNINLLARLGLVRIAVPPLNLRKTDILPLAQYFAERFALANDLPVRPFDPGAVELLMQHDWPGNVRELEDTVHRAVLLNRADAITASSIVTVDGHRFGNGAAAAQPNAQFVARTVEDVERELILRTLQHCRGNRTTASTILGISVRTMRNKLRTFIEAGVEVSPCGAGRAA